MKVDILGVKIDSLTSDSALKKIEDFVSSAGQHQIITANPEIVLKAWVDEKYLNLINRAELVTADGSGLLWAAKFLSLKSRGLFFSLIQLLVSAAGLILSRHYCKEVLPERITGVDLMDKICELASKKHWKIYLLGAGEGIAPKTAQQLKNKYLNLVVGGAESGHHQINLANSQEINLLIHRINSQNPQILFVAFGAPQQEIWIKNNLPKLPSVKIAMGVGGAFDYLSKSVKRAPEIYRELNLEWLFRLFNEPKRLVRIFNATVKFIFNVIKYKQLMR